MMAGLSPWLRSLQHCVLQWHHIVVISITLLCLLGFDGSNALGFDMGQAMKVADMAAKGLKFGRQIATEQKEDFQKYMDNMGSGSRTLITEEEIEKASAPFHMSTLTESGKRTLIMETRGGDSGIGSYTLPAMKIESELQLDELPEEEEEEDEVDPNTGQKKPRPPRPGQPMHMPVSPRKKLDDMNPNNPNNKIPQVHNRPPPEHIPGG